MSLNKPLTVLVLIVLSAGKSFGQAAASPYSSLGLGDYNGNGQANVQGMAGVSISNPQFYYLNISNPALLVFNTLTSYQAGIVGDSRKTRDGTLTQKSRGGNLNYMMLGFPIKRNKWATAIHISPYTTVDYNYSYDQQVPGTTTTATFTESGKGGINQLSWSHGVALHKNLSVGARVNYLYSSTQYDHLNTFSFTDQTIIITPFVSERYHYHDFSYTGAVSFHKDSLFNHSRNPRLKKLADKNYRLNFGAVYDLKTNLSTNYFKELVRENQVGQTLNRDTLTIGASGVNVLPPSISAGLSFGRMNHWLIGADVKFTDYSKAKSFIRSQSITNQAWRFALGAEVIPDVSSLSNYFKRLIYRTGVSFEKYPYLTNGNPIRDFGINFGLSMPFSRYSSVDLGFRWGKRGNIAANTIEEKYFKIYFGVTFNDQWFIKRRFD